MPDGDYRDIAHPINSEARGIIQKFVLEAYDRALAELEEELTEESPAEEAVTEETDSDESSEQEL